MTAELSPQRIGRITGSRVAAIIGVDKYRTRDDVMREMVRQVFGAEPEFTGNVATEHGNDHEEEARAAYEREMGLLVLDAQEFIVHPEHDWLGVSPDGLVPTNGMVEFKCPYRAQYRSIAEKPEYAAQIQLQLACTGREWCDFVIWREGEPLIIETVKADPEWLPKHLDTLHEFMAEFTTACADETLHAPHLAPLVVERDDAEWQFAAETYLASLESQKAIEEDVAQARARLLELADGRASSGAGVSVSYAERKGSVDWQKAVKKYAPDADPDEFRKPSTTVATVRQVTS